MQSSLELFPVNVRRLQKSRKLTKSTQGRERRGDAEEFGILFPPLRLLS